MISIRKNIKLIIIILLFVLIIFFFTQNNNINIEKFTNYDGQNLSSATGYNHTVRPSDFSYSSFNNTNLTGINFGNCNLDFSDLSRAIIIREGLATDINATQGSGEPVTLDPIPNFYGSSLRGINLSGLNLSNVTYSIKPEIPKNRYFSQFQYANFTNPTLYYQPTKLRNTNLSYANIQYANLSGLDFTSEYLSGCNLYNADLRGCNLSYTKGIDFANLNLFSGRSIPPQPLLNTDLSGVDLTNCPVKILLTIKSIENADLSKLDLSGINISSISTNIISANFTNANLSNVSFSGLNLTGLKLINANLSNANLSNAYLYDINLTNANLYNSNLYGISSGNITGIIPPQLPDGYSNINGYIIGPNVNLSSANLSYINLNGTNLNGANLINANLFNISSGGILGTPNLPNGYSLTNNGYIIGPNVNLSNTNLQGFNFTGINLTNANLNNIISGSITGITSQQLPSGYSYINGYIIGPNVNLTNADLTGLDLSNTNLIGVTSENIIGNPTLPNGYSITDTGCIIGPGVNLVGKSIINQDLTSINLSNSNLSGSFFNNSNLTNANLNGANLDNALFFGTTLSGIITGRINGDIIGLPNNYFQKNRYIFGPNVNLAGAKLQNIDLSEANLSNVNLVGAILSKVNFNGANLTNCNLTEMKASECNFSGADLTNSNLTNVVLGLSNLTSTNLSNTNLTNAYLATSDLNNVISNNIFSYDNVYLPGGYSIENGQLINQNSKPKAPDLSDVPGFSLKGLIPGM